MNLAAPASPMRIGLLIPGLQLGGAERVCSLLASHWARCGHAVTLMTFELPGTDAFTLDPRVDRIVLGGAQLTAGRWQALTKNLRRVRRLRRQMLDSRLDVVVSFMNVANVCLAFARPGTPTLCIGSERTYPPALPPSRLRDALRRWSYGGLDAVVATTADAADWVRANTNAKAVCAIPNPAVLPLPSRPPWVEPTAWRRPGAPLLLAAGRLNEGKQFDQLIRAFVRASAAHPEWQLAVVGDGPCAADLQRLVDALGAQHSVLLPGAAGNMADWFGAASLFALSSSFEGYPNVLLEALAHGVPSVAYDCLTGPRDLIDHGVNGLLVPSGDEPGLADALARLMGDAALRQRMAQCAGATREANAIGRIAERWEAEFTAARTRRSAG